MLGTTSGSLSHSVPTIPSAADLYSAHEAHVRELVAMYIEMLPHIFSMERLRNALIRTAKQGKNRLEFKNNCRGDAAYKVRQAIEEAITVRELRNQGYTVEISGPDAQMSAEEYLAVSIRISWSITPPTEEVPQYES